MIRTKRSKQPDFADILSAFGDEAADPPSNAAIDDADEEPTSSAPAPDGAPHPAHRLRRILGSVAWRWRFRIGGSPSETAAAYAAEAEEAEPKDHVSARRGEPHDPSAAPAAQSEDDAIAVELGLRADLADADLKQIRRDFAKKNHPDCFGPAQRLRAARRMSIANMLIDQHLKQNGRAR